MADVTFLPGSFPCIIPAPAVIRGREAKTLTQLATNYHLADLRTVNWSMVGQYTRRRPSRAMTLA